MQNGCLCRRAVAKHWAVRGRVEPGMQGTSWNTIIAKRLLVCQAASTASVQHLLGTLPDSTRGNRRLPYLPEIYSNQVFYSVVRMRVSRPERRWNWISGGKQASPDPGASTPPFTRGQWAPSKGQCGANAGPTASKVGAISHPNKGLRKSTKKGRVGEIKCFTEILFSCPG